MMKGKNYQKTEKEKTERKPEDKTQIEYPTKPFGSDLGKFIITLGNMGGIDNSASVGKKAEFSGGTLSLIVSSAKFYNLIENAGKKIRLTDLGKKYLDANAEQHKIILRESFRSVDVFRKVASELLTMPKTFGELKRKFENCGVSQKWSGTVASVFKQDIDYLGLTIEQTRELLRNEQDISDMKASKEVTAIGGHIPSLAITKPELIQMGYTLGILECLQTKDEQSFSKLLEDFKESIGFPSLKRETEMISKMISNGYMPLENAIRYAKEHFRFAVETDIGKSLTNSLDKKSQTSNRSAKSKE